MVEFYDQPKSTTDRATTTPEGRRTTTTKETTTPSTPTRERPSITKSTKQIQTTKG